MRTSYAGRANTMKNQDIARGVRKRLMMRLKNKKFLFTARHLQITAELAFVFPAEHVEIYQRTRCSLEGTQKGLSHLDIGHDSHISFVNPKVYFCSETKQVNHISIYTDPSINRIISESDRDIVQRQVILVD